MKPEESFEKLYHKGNESQYTKSLKTDGTWLNDDEIYQLFCLLAWKKGMKCDAQVRCIPPSLTKLLMESTARGWTTVEPGIKDEFTKNVPPLLLVPICHSGHWSLIYRRTATNKWYHMDSMGSYHHEYSGQVMRMLASLGIIEWDTKKDQLHRFVGVARQPGTWQCGTAVLLFMLIVMESSDDQDIQNHVVMTDEFNRRMLVSVLIKMLSSL